MASYGGSNLASKTSKSTSQMSSVAAYYDILVLIFSYFALDGRKQLRDLSVVCKSFSGPALDCLWTNLDSLTPLLKLHPALKAVDNSHFYLGPFDSADAVRFHAYARRIRSIRLTDGTNEETQSISLAGFAWLGQQLQGAPLMPGLKTIYFSNPNRDSVHMGLLPLVLSSSVQSVTFDGQFLSADVFRSYALPLVCSAASTLKRLSLCDVNPVSAPGIWDCLSAIASTVQLQHLKITFPSNQTLNPASLGKLGRMFETLTLLSLDVHTASHTPSGDVMEEGLLPLLRSLHLVNRCEAKLCQCYPPFLLQRATSVTFHSSRHILDAGAFHEAVETLSRSKALRKVEISAYINGSSHIIIPSALARALERLNLEEFIVNGECFEVPAGNRNQNIISIIDASFGKHRQGCTTTLQKLTTPLLRVQPATSNGKRDPGGFPSISSFLYIARHAQGLKHISMAIDSSVVGTSGESLHPAEYRDIACLLDSIFPHLKTIKPIDFPQGQVKSNWNAHWELIEELRRMRKALKVFGMKGE